ncbi:Ig domain-containing protein [Eubacteriaceae bacterium ES3]|nr:Ig domain-containing protein [Eubacteriaceae bacterium ES3]
MRRKKISTSRSVVALAILVLIPLIFPLGAFAKESEDSSINIGTESEIGVSYGGHIENYGDIASVSGPETLGSSGQGLRIEGVWIELTGDVPESASINYQVHVQDQGWMKAVSDGDFAGTSGKGLRVESIKIWLEDLDGYDVYYRGHVQNEGNMPTEDDGTWGWVKNGQELGTTGSGLRLEELQIRIVKAEDSENGDEGEDETSTPVAVTGITLDKESVTLIAGGETDTITATVSPSDASNKDIIWTTSNSDIVTVNNGTVTPVEAGTATITATAASNSGRTATVAVTVKAGTSAILITSKTYFPNVIVRLTGDSFLSESLEVRDWVIDTGTTGMYNSSSGWDHGTLYFGFSPHSGNEYSAGTITIQLNGGVLASGVDAEPLTVQLSDTHGISTTPVAGAISIAKTAIRQSSVDFNIISSHTGGLWYVYSDSRGGRVASGISASFNNGILTLSHEENIPSGTYYIGWIDGLGDYQSELLALTVTDYFVPSNVKVISDTSVGSLYNGNLVGVPEGTKVSDLKAGLTVSLYANAEILKGAGGAVVADQENTDVTAEMVIQVTALDGSTAEYTIAMDSATE